CKTRRALPRSRGRTVIRGGGETRGAGQGTTFEPWHAAGPRWAPGVSLALPRHDPDAEQHTQGHELRDPHLRSARKQVQEGLYPLHGPCCRLEETAVAADEHPDLREPAPLQERSEVVDRVLT